MPNQVMNVGDEVRIDGATDTGIILAVEDGGFLVRCDCGLEWRYDAADLELIAAASVGTTEPRQEEQ